MLSVVIGLHVLAIQWFLSVAEPLPVAQPLPMEVALVKLTPPKPDTTTTSAPQPTQAKLQTKKIQPKPKLKKQPSQAEPSDFSTSKQVLAQHPVVNNETLPAIPVTENERTNTAQLAYTEAYVNAAYQHNPKPDYPSIARSRGWQGKVILRVEVKEDGKPEVVEIDRSSGYELLDESAVDAVKQWQFVPARLGEKAVASSVLIPIVFALQDQEAW